MLPEQTNKTEVLNLDLAVVNHKSIFIHFGDRSVSFATSAFQASQAWQQRKLNMLLITLIDKEHQVLAHLSKEPKKKTDRRGLFGLQLDSREKGLLLHKDSIQKNSI